MIDYYTLHIMQCTRITYYNYNIHCILYCVQCSLQCTMVHCTKSSYIFLILSFSIPVVINSLAILTTYSGASDRFKSTIVRDGAIAPICDLAQSEDVRIQKGSGGAILNLSHVQVHTQEVELSFSFSLSRSL